MITLVRDEMCSRLVLRAEEAVYHILAAIFSTDRKRGHQEGTTSELRE
jgi:hypothetical protein